MANTRNPGYLLARSRRLRIMLSEAFFNVMRLSDNYNCITYYNQATDTVEIKLVDSQTSIEAKMLEGIPAEVLIAYAKLVQTLEEWLSDTSKPYPFTYEQDSVDQYRESISG